HNCADSHYVIPDSSNVTQDFELGPPFSSCDREYRVRYPIQIVREEMIRRHKNFGTIGILSRPNPRSPIGNVCLVPAVPPQICCEIGRSNSPQCSRVADLDLHGRPPAWIRPSMAVSCATSNCWARGIRTVTVSVITAPSP